MSAPGIGARLALLADHTPGLAIDSRGDAIMRLRSVDAARRAWRRASLRYAAGVLRKLGYDGAAHALEAEVRTRLAAGTGEHESIR